MRKVILPALEISGSISTVGGEYPPPVFAKGYDVVLRSSGHDEARRA